MEGQTGLVEPRSAWHQDVKDVLGLVRPIAEGPKSTLKLLQVKFEEDLDDNVLKEQLEALIQRAANQHRVDAKDCEPIYRRLSQAPTLGSWIWTEHGFASYEDVFKHSRAHALQPFLHTLQSDWVSYEIFKDIQQQPEIPKLLQVLSGLKKLQGEEPTNVPSSFASSTEPCAEHRLLEVACVALKYLYQEVDSLPEEHGQEVLMGFRQQHGQHVWIPAADGVLRLASQLFVHDMPWASSQPPAFLGFHRVHSEVPAGHARAFGVEASSVLLLRMLQKDPVGL